jgi:hypothetical protein
VLYQLSYTRIHRHNKTKKVLLKEKLVHFF